MSESSPAPVDVFIDTIHSDSAIHSPAPATIESPPVSSSLVQDTDPSPDIQVVIPYKSAKSRTYTVHTPSRKRCIKRITRKTYCSMASTLVNSPTLSKSVITQVANKIKSEMKAVSSDAHDSILRDTVEGVKHFSWETVWLELSKNMPTLISLLSQIVRQGRPLISFLSSQLLKSRHQRLCLVQRAISVMMFGNGAAKQMFINMQPLNVCMSYQGTLKTIERISEDHDVEVQMWSDELLPVVDGCSQSVQPSSYLVSSCDLDDSLSESELSDTEAPSFSSPSSTNSSDEETLVDENLDKGGGDPDVEDSENLNGISTVNELPDKEHASSVPEREKDLPGWFGYKFVGDNIDKNVKASHQRHELKGQSLHHFHGYAVKDRINLSGVSDEAPAFRTPDPALLLPTTQDVSSLKEEFCVLVSRVLDVYMGEFDDHKEVVQHIPSRFSKEMARKSTTVPLGVLLYNENKLDEMGKIMAHYMTLVPTTNAEGHFTLPSGDVMDFDDTRFHKILFGGDQLTVARMRGTQALRDTQDKPVDRLEGVIPVAEDWHTRMTLMKVIWGRLYKTKSTKEKGTLYQLRNLIGRTSVPASPDKNMKSCEDFLLLILHAHIIEAGRVLQLQNPTNSVLELAKSIVNKFIRLPNMTDTPVAECDDGVYVYATELLSLSLLWHGFHDAIKEADGDRILRYWKFLYIVFKTTSHRNYAKEALNVLMQYNYTMSERQKSQLIWSRCINTRGYAGANIPCDLYMEHLNRRLKTAIRSMGANVKPTTIVKNGRALASIHHVCQVFEEETTGHSHSNRHRFPSFGKDFYRVLNVIDEENVFVKISGRKYPSFSLDKGLFESQSLDELKKKVKSSIEGLL